MNVPEKDSLKNKVDMPIIDLGEVIRAMNSNRTASQHMDILVEAVRESFSGDFKELAV